MASTTTTMTSETANPPSTDEKSLSNFQLSCIKKGYMNAPKKKGGVYMPTHMEHQCNCWSHGLMIIPAIVGMVHLLVRSPSLAHMRVAWLYGSTLVALFLCSTLFHLFESMPRFRGTRILHFFHRADHFMIYIFIASCYVPWTALQYDGPYCTEYNATIWTVAISGVVYSMLYHQKNVFFETSMYVCLGVLPALPLALLAKNKTGLFECAVGGASYLIGVVFFGLDGTVPCSHAIWHMHVTAGAVIHYIAIRTHLY